MNRIILVGKANEISAQLAAMWPMFRVPNFKQINSNGGEKSRHRTAPSASEAAEHPTSAADHGERR